VPTIYLIESAARRAAVSPRFAPTAIICHQNREFFDRGALPLGNR
jgi:hypothetical protein